ncbi:hypothetical protein PYW07_011784 [Mythimna separata]|uniref:BPTI/Kunitz inhibitor domain-containing protein n=1 Tax=Mythimna separata TaxID=271217 RepID=A0AAD7Y6R7_MYTSE|nr:hypothetical protein PYW07_011784 [Mythimna separata]
MKFTIILLAIVFISKSFCGVLSDESNVKYYLKGFNRVCTLPIDPGNCLLQVTRYAFIPAINACVVFTYRGCDGNQNNFETLAECEEVCPTTSSSESTDVEDYFK